MRSAITLLINPSENLSVVSIRLNPSYQEAGPGRAEELSGDDQPGPRDPAGLPAGPHRRPGGQRRDRSRDRGAGSSQGRRHSSSFHFDLAEVCKLHGLVILP